VQEAEMKGDDIAERLMGFAVGVIEVTRKMKKGIADKHIARQLVRSGTAGGANYEEARASESRADFAHKIAIAAKEMRESWYWLKLTEEAALTEEQRIKTLSQEARELAAILSSSARTAKSRT
jgi:four helix bundle protein